MILFYFNSLIRSVTWAVDAKVFTSGVRANAREFHYTKQEALIVAQCSPDPTYMKHNPVRAVFYHKRVQKARLVRRLLSFFTDNEYIVGKDLVEILKLVQLKS